jgi:hypothetical protein
MAKNKRIRIIKKAIQKPKKKPNKPKRGSRTATNKKKKQ